MKYPPTSDLFFYTIFAIFFSLFAAFLAFYGGPQISHSINCVALLIMIIVIIKFFKTFKHYRKQLLNKILHFILLNILILVELLFAIFLIIIRYGYSNWNYSYIFIINPPY
ncbi:hypothetical protein AEQU2_02862 [Aequorivita lipolytica]|nr:hypothetical protein AEQU2_02862 [Aequorivita lipolytica]